MRLARFFSKNSKSLARLNDEVEILHKSALLDPVWYRQTYPDLHDKPIDVARHYLEHGALEGRNPHPLFDTRFYLEQNQDLAASTTNPLLHYILIGWKEGRNPHPVFDVRWYLDQNPDVKGDGVEPLGHYIRYGRNEGRSPSPHFCSESHPIGGNEHRRQVRNRHPQVEYRNDSQPRLCIKVRQLHVRATSRVKNPTGPLLACVTHVSPWPRRAGNEYRIGRFLDWLQKVGFRIIVVLAPLDETFSDNDLHSISERYGDIIAAERDGTIRVVSRSGLINLNDLDGHHVRNISELLGEVEECEHEILRIERTFCHDVLIESLLHLQRANRPVIFYVNYIFMTRWLALMDRRHRSFVDMHDLFSSKADKVTRFGIKDSLSLPVETEGRLLSRADAIVAIQCLEAEVVRRMLPDRTVLTVGVDFDFPERLIPPASGYNVLVVGSGNQINRKGLADFLRFAWPRIRAVVPKADLRIAGKIGESTLQGLDGVTILGPVPDLANEYKAAKVVINPTIAGTGLKVKTIEALVHSRDIVVWPNGADGLPAEIAGLCHIAGDWCEFAELVSDILNGQIPSNISVHAMTAIQNKYSDSAVYSSFRTWLTSSEAKVF